MFVNYYIDHKILTLLLYYFITKSNSTTEAAATFLQLNTFCIWIKLSFALDDVKDFFYTLFIKSKKRISQFAKKRKKDPWLGNSSKFKYFF